MSHSSLPTPTENANTGAAETDKNQNQLETDDLAGLPTPEAKEKLEQALQKLQPQERTMMRESLREFMGVVVSSGGQKIDPETARMILESVNQDNENKFKFALQREENRASQQQRKDNLELTRLTTQTRMLWPIIVAAIVVVVGCICAGLYFIAIGKESIGTGILTAVISAVFGYLGGLGTANFFSKK